MKVNTKRRKKARKGFRQIYEENELADEIFHVIQTGKQRIDAVILELGEMGMGATKISTKSLIISNLVV